MDTKPSTSKQLGVAILNALGIDTKRVLSLTLDCTGHEPAMLTLRLYVPPSLADGVAEELKRFELVPIDAQEPPAAA